MLEVKGVADLIKELFVCCLVGHRQCYNFASFPFKRMKAIIEVAIRIIFIFENCEKPRINISYWVFIPTCRYNNILGARLLIKL